MSRAARAAVRDVATRLRRTREGLCVECGQPNDRAGQKTKAGRQATKCTACVEIVHGKVAAKRADADAHRADMAAALGLTPAQAASLTRRERERL